MVIRPEPAMVTCGQFLTSPQNLVDPGKLPQTQRAVHIGKPIAKAWLAMLEPSGSRHPPLIAQTSDMSRQWIGSGHQRAAFSAGDHLVRIETKNANVSARSRFMSTALRPEGFAGIFNHSQGMPPGECDNLFHTSREAKRMDNEDGLCPVA